MIVDCRCQVEVDRVMCKCNMALGSNQRKHSLMKPLGLSPDGLPILFLFLRKQNNFRIEFVENKDQQLPKNRVKLIFVLQFDQKQLLIFLDLSLCTSSLCRDG